MQFVSVIDTWKKENDMFLQPGKDMEKNGILNHWLLPGDIEQFAVDHYRLMNRTLELLRTQSRFAGGDDPAQCAFGQWMASFTTDNEVIKASLDEIAPFHNKVHECVGRIKAAVSGADTKRGFKLYWDEMVSAVEEFLKRFDVLRNQAAAATELYAGMEKQAGVAACAKQGEALLVGGNRRTPFLGKASRRETEFSSRLASVSTLTSHRPQNGNGKKRSGKQPVVREPYRLIQPERMISLSHRDLTLCATFSTPVIHACFKRESRGWVVFWIPD